MKEKTYKNELDYSLYIIKLKDGSIVNLKTFEVILKNKKSLKIKRNKDVNLLEKVRPILSGPK